MSDAPRIDVTPWSKIPLRTVEEVTVEIVAVEAVHETMILLNKRNGYSMALFINAAGIDFLQRELTAIQRRFRQKPVKEAR
jgi:hypothetical protein